MSAESCKLAFQAALELVGDKCNLDLGKNVARFDEINTVVGLPEKVLERAEHNPELTREERIEAIKETEWTKGWAEGMCRLVEDMVEPECVERMKTTLAERVV